MYSFYLFMLLIFLCKLNKEDIVYIVRIACATAGDIQVILKFFIAIFVRNYFSVAV